jgi:hypothetical protein
MREIFAIPLSFAKTGYGPVFYAEATAIRTARGKLTR